ncbi:MAG: hypothetical protein ABIO70_19805, partial [Pseudomonadota bacterium]
MDLAARPLPTRETREKPVFKAVPRPALRAALGAFLTGPALLDAEGAVLSWAGPGAFPYPEAAGIWLAWAAWRAGRGEPSAPPAIAGAVARRL